MVSNNFTVNRVVVKKSIPWKYIIIYLSLVLINFLPSITEIPYQPKDIQDVIINLLKIAIEPYRVYGPVFHLASLILLFFLLWKPGRMGRIFAGYLGVNYLIIAFAQTMGQTQKYGFVVHLAALVTMVILGITWVVVAFRGDLHPSFRRIRPFEYILVVLAVLAYWAPYKLINGIVLPNFDPRYLLISPDFGLTFCFTTPVFLLLLIMIYPHVSQFAYRITAFSGLLYALFNLTHWFNPATRWMGVLHIPLLIISIYALILPGLLNRQHQGLSELSKINIQKE